MSVVPPLQRRRRLSPPAAPPLATHNQRNWFFGLKNLMVKLSKRAPKHMSRFFTNFHSFPLFNTIVQLNLIQIVSRITHYSALYIITINTISISNRANGSAPPSDGFESLSRGWSAVGSSTAPQSEVAPVRGPTGFWSGVGSCASPISAVLAGAGCRVRFDAHCRLC